MRSRFLRRPSPATVIASIALFVSLGGVSYGVATGSIDGREIKNNSVSNKDIKNNDVRGRDIRAGAVNGSDVANDSLTGGDIAESSLGRVPSASAAGTAGSANTANNANALGGLAPGAYQRAAQWVLVQPNGTIAAQSGGITVTKGGAGRYGIDFNSPTAGRLVLASSALANDEAFRGVVSAAPCTGGLPEAYGTQTCPGGNAPDKVEVFTDNPGETATQDHSFYVGLL